MPDFDGKARSEAPEQDFRQIMQQRGEGDLFDVPVVPFERPFVGVAGGLLDAPDDVQHARRACGSSFSSASTVCSDSKRRKKGSTPSIYMTALAMVVISD